MQSVRQKDTGPELVVRRLVHRLGFRYRLHVRDLPGKPDLVLPRHRKVVFVHGCFWHGHGCSKGQLPKSRLDYWGPKIARNIERDKKAEEELARRGWRSLTIWQCQTKDTKALSKTLIGFLGANAPTDQKRQAT